jgi:1,4-alpha-glucan branching enzyme
MLFMGQEFYEDKQWSDDPSNHDGLIYWDGLATDRTMQDFHRFSRELIWLRRKHPALRGEGVQTVLMDNGARVLGFQRWVPDEGRDVMVVASLNEQTLFQYRIPVPAPGRWFEAFNSDAYENWMNPAVAGNGGAIQVSGPPMNNLSYSATITVPANAILIFARD